MNGAYSASEKNCCEDSADAEYRLECKGTDIWDEPDVLAFSYLDVNKAVLGDLRNIGVALEGVSRSALGEPGDQ